MRPVLLLQPQQAASAVDSRGPDRCLIRSSPLALRTVLPSEPTVQTSPLWRSRWQAIVTQFITRW
jgi:hypothetical protein